MVGILQHPVGPWTTIALGSPEGKLLANHLRCSKGEPHGLQHGTGERGVRASLLRGREGLRRDHRVAPLPSSSTSRIPSRASSLRYRLSSCGPWTSSAAYFGRETWINPLIFAIICYEVSAILGGLLSLVGFSGSRGFGAFIISIILAPIFAAIGLFIGAGILHLLVMVIVGSRNSGFEATFRVGPIRR